MLINENISLKNYNSFGIDVKCNKLIFLEQQSDIKSIIHLIGDKYLFIGGGSNILFINDFAGTVIQNNIKGIEKVKETNNKIFLRVAAGEIWDDFVNYCIDNQYYGVENLIGIPGRVGSAPVQNIGAYGCEVKDVIESVEGIFIDTGQKIKFLNKECYFAYRESVFKLSLKNKVLIEYVTFCLSKISKFNLSYNNIKNIIETREISLSLKNVASLVNELRNSKLPDISQIGSAGSFFKNPILSQHQVEKIKKQYPNLITYNTSSENVKLAAAQLIELCGWKGYRKNDAGVWHKQPLVLVNYGNATGRDIETLYKKIQKSIKLKFGLNLDLEVNIIKNEQS